jgi:kynurenine formamidase
MSRRLLAAVIIAWASAVGALPALGEPTSRPGSASVGSTHEIVDLTHTLDHEFPFIPVPGITFPFGLEAIATIPRHGVAANRWTIHEHLGTQIDAPNHFTLGGKGLHELTAGELVVPAIVIDFRAEGARNPDAELTVDGIRRWEGVHGRIPAGSVALLFTGWEAKIRNPRAYIGLDVQGVKHFPGIGKAAGEFLVKERDVWGVGVDTLSFDPGYDNTYQTHKVVLGAGKWALEAVANLYRLPPTGATLFIGAPKVRDATGGPVRIVAWVPKPPPILGRLDGRWRSTTPEPIIRPDGQVVYLRRTLSIDGRKWSMAFTFSADANGTRPLFWGRNSGAVSIGDYRALDQTYEALFAFDRRRLTPHTPKTAEALTAAGCGAAAWAVGVEQDVTETGCPPFRVRALASCAGEYDVVRLTKRGLWLGARPADGDLCTPDRRPEHTGSQVLRRVTH